MRARVVPSCRSSNSALATSEGFASQPSMRSRRHLSRSHGRSCKPRSRTASANDRESTRLCNRDARLQQRANRRAGGRRLSLESVQQRSRARDALRRPVRVRRPSATTTSTASNQEGKPPPSAMDGSRRSSSTRNPVVRPAWPMRTSTAEREIRPYGVSGKREAHTRRLRAPASPDRRGRLRSGRPRTRSARRRDGSAAPPPGPARGGRHASPSSQRPRANSLPKRSSRPRRRARRVRGPSRTTRGAQLPAMAPSRSSGRQSPVSVRRASATSGQRRRSFADSSISAQAGRIPSRSGSSHTDPHAGLELELGIADSARDLQRTCAIGCGLLATPRPRSWPRPECG